MAFFESLGVPLKTERGNRVFPVSDNAHDIARALDEGLIAGAALDVYVKEPLAMSSPLMNLKHPERLLLTPHIAWYSREARARLAHEMAENIRKGF